MADITDGASITYLAGEKFLDPDQYVTGTDWGDDQSAYSGDCDDLCRWTGQDTATTIVTNPPLPDTPGNGNWSIFGSAIKAASTWRFATARFTRSIIRSTRRFTAGWAIAATA